MNLYESIYSSEILLISKAHSPYSEIQSTKQIPFL